jgi:hypothetical protein
LTIPQSHSGSEICTQDVIPVAETVTLVLQSLVQIAWDGAALKTSAVES